MLKTEVCENMGMVGFILWFIQPPVSVSNRQYKYIELIWVLEI